MIVDSVLSEERPQRTSLTKPSIDGSRRNRNYVGGHGLSGVSAGVRRCGGRLKRTLDHSQPSNADNQSQLWQHEHAGLEGHFLKAWAQVRLPETSDVSLKATVRRANDDGILRCA